MKITFYSNFLNHHQLPFCLAMNEMLEGEFTFVACTPVPDARIKLGYEDMNHKYPFVLTVYDNPDNLKRAGELVYESEITIHGSAPDNYLKIREMTKKPCFVYSERLFKPGTNENIVLRTYLAYQKHHIFRNGRNTYLLCASYYTAFDYGALGKYLSRQLAWGYFPQHKKYDVGELMRRKAQHEKVVLMWAGRMIDWKHPEVAVETAHYLDRHNIAFEMKMIGDGLLKKSLEQRIDAYGLRDKIQLLGAVPAEEVRYPMEEASVFLFTSDYNEGWGAVLNESMNSGCAVLVSHAIGAAGFLIQNGHNGIVYPNGNQEELNFWAEKLIRDREYREKMGTNAYHTIYDTWNANQGAERFVAVCERIMNHQDVFQYKNGPCSKAIRSSNRQYEKTVRKELKRIRERYEHEQYKKEDSSDYTL